MATTELVVVATFGNQIDAAVAKSALEAAGIESIVKSDDAGGVQPGLWAGQGVQLLVREEDLERAHEVLI